jgi:glutathione S-transferase
VFFGGKVPEAIKGKAREDLLAGFATLKRHARFAPFVAGDTFTLADIVFLYSVDLAAAVGKQLFGLDLLGDIPPAQALLQRLNENPHAKTIAAKREAGLPAFVAGVRARVLRNSQPFGSSPTGDASCIAASAFCPRSEIRRSKVTIDPER